MQTMQASHSPEVDEARVVATLINPADDGTTHINIYSRGRTELGCALSNFAHISFQHPTFGRFASMEGYWYWVATGMHDEQLRLMWGFGAKSYGCRLTRVKLDVFEFQQFIIQGLICKVVQNPALCAMLIDSTLPFRHYFVYGKGEAGVRQMVIDQTGKHLWQVEAITNLRTYCQAVTRGQIPPEGLFEGVALEILRQAYPTPAALL